MKALKSFVAAVAVVLFVWLLVLAIGHRPIILVVLSGGLVFSGFWMFVHNCIYGTLEDSHDYY